MKTPIIYILQSDANKNIEQDFHTRYGKKYHIELVATGAHALQAIRKNKEIEEHVAILLVHQSLSDMTGTEFLSQAAAYYPEARKILIAEAKDTEAAITSINQLGIHYYFVAPWQTDNLNRIDELLEDWRSTIQLPYMYVKGIMNTHVARIRANSNLHIAAEMVALSGISDLMVVNDSGIFAGVLSEGDILRAALPDIDEIVNEGGTLEDAYQIFLRRGSELSDKPIAPLIIRDPITLQPDDHVAKAATILISKQIRLLPVVKDGRLLGTVSRANICEAVVGDW
jgi:CBS domain-containing protein/CheY-like chemotaxis protein